MNTSTTLLSFHNPAGLYDPAPNGYSHLALVQGPARWLLLSGQGGEHPSAGLPEDFEGQLAQCLSNVQTALRAGGADLRDVARLTVLVVGHSEARLAQFSQALKSLWGEAPTPACTLIPVPRLALDGMLIEIEATAVLTPPKAGSG
ncbi:RidA family protein [Paucibacter sp. XJ19-41]|uniref:RidA family protein n=1 Tax=Paucibacter sp. XJ19-41 TaxID=2927824 RepID=UPI002349893A|nr:RidA family protein [Paucibacter sp. XJ19-41]MDC6167395.1 RidA family protein [Paucibacter sp. XJ19-41]